MELDPGTILDSRTAAQQATLRTAFATIAFFAGLTTPFTVNVVGEMPIGEVLLFGVAFYCLCYMIMERRWPVPLLAQRPFQILMFCQFVAFLGYVMSDLYRGSDPHDLLRGWARMIFLAIDLLATSFLFGISSVNFVLMGGVGVALGLCLFTTFVGPLFGDYWKFGYGGPFTVLLVVIMPNLSMALTPVAVAAMGCLHLALGFRSLGAECLLLAVLLVVLRFPPRTRSFVLPVLVIGAAAGAALFYLSHQGAEEGSRATRSNVERSAMMTAAWDGFAGSPLIGQGSWFSKSDVMTHFVDLRTQWASEAGIGGFDAEDSSETVTLHSQILVGLAEGGILGGCFFVVYGINIILAIGFCVLQRPLDKVSAIYLLVLVASLSNLFFSPFSGAHRENIAVAAGVVLVCWQQWREARELRDRQDPRRSSSPGWRSMGNAVLAAGTNRG